MKRLEPAICRLECEGALAARLSRQRRRGASVVRRASVRAGAQAGDQLGGGQLGGDRRVQRRLRQARSGRSACSRTAWPRPGRRAARRAARRRAGLRPAASCTVLTRLRYCCAPTIVGFASTRSSNWAMAIRFSIRFFSAAAAITIPSGGTGGERAALAPQLGTSRSKSRARCAPGYLPQLSLSVVTRLNTGLSSAVVDAVGHEIAVALELHARLGAAARRPTARRSRCVTRMLFGFSSAVSDARPAPGCGTANRRSYRFSVTGTPSCAADPGDRALDLDQVGARRAALRVRHDGGEHGRDVAVGVLLAAGAFDDDAVLQAHLVAREQALVALGRHFEEVVALDPHRAGRARTRAGPSPDGADAPARCTARWPRRRTRRPSW